MLPPPQAARAAEAEAGYDSDNKDKPKRSAECAAT